MKRDPLRAAATVFGAIAAAFLVFMMLFTTYAVIAREVFDAPVLGVVEIMSFGLVGCVFLALPGVFLRDDNITVDLMDQVTRSPVRKGLRLIGLVLSLGFLIVALSQMFVPADEMHESGEVTMTLSFRKVYYWIPILLGFGLSIVAVAIVIIHYLRSGIPDTHSVELKSSAGDMSGFEASNRPKFSHQDPRHEP